MVDVAVAVIGRGMVGSAAARHLAEAGVSVALVGSGEPADYADPGTATFASHYDAGRITRISDADPVWAELAVRSIQRYADIEARSGISFHVPCGLAQASMRVDEIMAIANERGGDIRRVDRDWLRRTTGITVRDDHPGEVFFEGAPAGRIAPRQMVAAQCTLAESAGCTSVLHAATSVARTTAGFEIGGDSGTVTARRVLLATGAYGAWSVGVDLALERRLRTVTLADLGPGESMPSYIDTAPADESISSLYWVPPARYPDGRTMLKIGGDLEPTELADSPADIADWFERGGSEREADSLADMVRALLPDADIAEWDHKPCVVTQTATNLPYIGEVDDGIVAVVGACGAGAKSSDEIGRLAASIATGEPWSDPVLDAARFEPVLV